MAKSQETFNKKEKEKARLKKKKEKEDRKEERKASAQKGQQLDDMLAYVDENGNLSTTPPDMSRKRDIRQDEIRIGIPRQEAGEAEPDVRQGVVTFFNESKGYGFIKDLKTQRSVFVHVRGLTDPIKENDRVTFEVEMGLKGENAIKVRKML
ncbi:cold-shock protein [Larkinella sp. VNQ87]|uniref:cold-shock protein n=1 Tax=Larkinella sp. VNQ87 TaxID=3400921 RepID=UPI003BFE3068